MNYTFTILDHSQGAKTASGESLTPALLATFAKVYTVYLNLHVGPVWGGEYLVRVDNAAMPGEVPCTIAPLLVQPPGANATAYHDDAGGPIILDGMGDSNTLFGPGNSHTIAFTHEMVEVVVNPSINTWCDQSIDPTSVLVQTAKEPGDPVEGQSWAISMDGISVFVSNFVLPSWFDPEGQPPYDYMSSRGMFGAQAPEGPFQLANGYRNDRNLRTGEITQVGLATRRPGRLSSRSFALGAR